MKLNHLPGKHIRIIGPIVTHPFASDVLPSAMLVSSGTKATILKAWKDSTLKVDIDGRTAFIHFSQVIGGVDTLQSL